MSITHGFELLRDEQIDELQTRARLYRHVRTGAELLSLENDDENKSFGVAFRTPPGDSTGVAHILEPPPTWPTSTTWWTSTSTRSFSR